MTPSIDCIRDYRLDCQERIRLHLMTRDFEDFRAEWESEDAGDDYYTHMKFETRMERFV